MKNNFKTYAKKSVSLFLAVLMVMSCWVWMAPEEAEAGSISATTYKVEISWTISNNTLTSGHIVYWTSGNGWGSKSEQKTFINSFSKDGLTSEGTYVKSFTTDEFPCQINLNVDGKGTNLPLIGDSRTRTELNYIKINGKEVATGGGFSGDNTMQIYPTNDAGNEGSANAASTYNWPKPMIAGFEDSSATADDININLNKVGEQNVSGTTSFDLSKYTFYDQYGKQIADTDKATFINNNRYSGEITTTTHVAGTKNSDDATENTDIWVNPNNDSQVVVAPNLQISDPQGSDGKAQYFLVRTYKVKDSWGGEQTSKVSAAVNVTYPNYTVNFNGGLSTAKIYADKEYTGKYSPSKYNGGTITLPSKVEAAGYTFYDFWSKPQPATGNASYNTAAADFAEPCTSEDFDSYTKMTGAEVDGDIVTVTEDGVEKRYYNAGVKMDPTTVRTIDVSENKANFKENWYAYWLAKDLSVKFYDVDGTFLGEKLVKSGQTQADITWPTSKYINTGYTSGAFKFTVDANIWETTAGVEINKNSYTFTEDLILTPKLTRTDFKDEYAVTFIDPNTGNSVAVGTDGSYDYRANIKTYADTAKGKIAATPNDVSSDFEFRYELLGWSNVKPTTGKNYHILLEDADFDVNGTAIGLNSDWVVRSDATYYPVYRRFTKTYVVEFHYKDATGADATRQLKFKYGSTLVPPTEYVPYSYVTKGFGYSFNKWSYTNADGDATLDYNATIPFTNEYISIEGAALDGIDGLDPIDITATYGAPVATPYTVTFNYIDSKGEETSSGVQVRNEQFILQGTVDTLVPAEKWENENQLYTYADKWEITEGAATVGVGGAEKKVGDIIDTADLITLSPTSNITFKAVYANPIPYFTVTYVDGTKTFKDRVLQGSNVPAWTEKVNNDNGTPDDTSDDFEEDKIYVPADYEGEGGTYEFQGWYNEKQTDAGLKVTNGNKVTTEDKVTDNLTLYSQFKFVPDTFEIKFMSYDGKVQLSAGEFEKGQNIEAIVAVANKAAQNRASDDTYEYLFLGWDKAVPTFCEGYDVTYTAQYKPVYKYYNVKWYNSKLVDGKWVADKSTSEVDGETVETNLLATTHHTYNSKLYTPAVDNLTCLETAPAGQNYVFAGWYYNDAEGKAVKYERGMLVTAEMEFYATYTLSAQVYTVTTVVKGETTKYDVAAGDKAVIPDPQAGYVDADKHDAFVRWYTITEVDGEEVKETFDIATEVISDNIKIYAEFTEGTHDFSEKELVSAPTYYAKGKMDVWCACDKAKTKKTEGIDMLTDTKIPTGTIYLGGLGSWSSTDEIGGAALDNGEITLYANANTDVIVTASDTGDVNDLYNPAGLGKGIKVIRAFIYPGKFETLTADSYGAAQSLTVDVYNDDTEALTNNANFSVKLGDFVVADLDESGNPQYDENNNVKYKNLESGESYIVYYYVVDKAGNQLRQKVRTAKFIYDDTKPAFTVEGESDDAALPTFCGVATVEGLEKGVVLTVNGTAVEVKYEDGAKTGTYEIKYAEGVDNVIITATDKAGNTFSKKIKVADHSYLTTEQAASCGVEGYKKVECIICGDVKAEETYDALDHIWSDRQVIPADCVNIGSIIVTCEICGEKVETKHEEDGVTPVIPALGHAFEKDENDEIVYTTVTASTCKTNGLAEAYCTECKGELEGGYITKELDLNPENHEDITITKVEADCVNDGYYTEACSCGVTIKSETYPATGHGTIDEGTAEWYVRTEPTCYQTGEKVLKCLVCSNFIEVDGVEVTEEIEATGEHVKTVTNPDTYKEEGVVKYHCATNGCPFKYDDKILENEEVKTYDVTFKDEDGNAIATFEDVVEGTAIKSTDEKPIIAPEKAATKENRYSFAGWVEVIKGEDGKETAGATYKLPLEVTKNMTLKASYKATKILYTHIFVVPDEWVSATADEVSTVQFAKLVGVYGDERVPAAVPTFKHKDADEDARLKALYTFEFKGWKNAKGELVTDFTITDNAVFTAYFEEKPIEYDVIFYNGSEVVYTSKVKGGAAAVYDNYVLGEDGKPALDDEGNKTLIIPEKAYDAENHYAFNNKWYTDAACENEYKGAAITEKTRLYAGYTATAHSLVTDTTKGDNGIIQKADCLLPEITAKKCSDEACGYTCEVQTADALGHDQYKRDAEGNHILVDGEKVINGANEEVGADKVIHYVVRCSVCNEVLSSDKISVTVKFVNYNNNVLGRKNYTLNDEIKYEGETPVKADDKENTYTFAGWSIDGDESGKIYTNAQLGKATVDVTFVAQFTASKKYYKVSYVDYNNNLLYNYTVTVDGKVIEGVVYGAALPEYKGTTDPETLTGPDYTEEGHYIFDKWEYDATYTVKGDVVVHPTFKLVAHNKQTTKTPATCTKAGGDTITCTGCAYHATVNATEPALGHAWGEGVVTTPPVFETQTPGVMTYTCTRCGVTKTEEIPGDSYTIKATVKDANGNPSSGVRVELLRKQDDGSYTYLTHKETDNNGVVIFAGLEKGDYRVYVTSTKTYNDATVNEDGTVTGGDITAQPENKPVDNSCKCSCHKNNFWGTIYRLIQKIIKFFTGKPSCCADPDGRI